MKLSTRMQVKIKNKERSVLPQQLLIVAIRFFASELLGIENANQISTNVTIDSSNKKVNGICKSATGIVTHTDITIWLNSKSLYDVLSILAHEMVHMAQRVTGRLMYIDGDSMTYFEGEPYDKSTIDWNDLPWEIEALSLQNKLVDNMIVALNKDKSTSKLLESFDINEIETAYESLIVL